MDDHEKEEIGRMVGMGVGVAGGSQLGNLLLPVPIVGAFAGGVLGAVIGSTVGRRAGKAVINGALAFTNTLRGQDLAPAPLGTDPRPSPPAITRGGYV